MDATLYTRGMVDLRKKIIATIEGTSVTSNVDVAMVLRDLVGWPNLKYSLEDLCPEGPIMDDGPRETKPVVSERFGIASEGKPVRRNYLDVCREFMDSCHAAGWQCTYRTSGAPPRVGGNWVFDKAVFEARTWAKENQSELLIKFEQEIAP